MSVCWRSAVYLADKYDAIFIDWRSTAPMSKNMGFQWQSNEVVPEIFIGVWGEQ